MQNIGGELLKIAAARIVLNRMEKQAASSRGLSSLLKALGSKIKKMRLGSIATKKQPVFSKADRLFFPLAFGVLAGHLVNKFRNKEQGRLHAGPFGLL